MNDDLDDTLYHVVSNDEEQYSIWPSYRDLPAGWRIRREAASKEDCLEYIRSEWTDMRPRSLREALAACDQTEARP